jgi:hypothetical protein
VWTRRRTVLRRVLTTLATISLVACAGGPPAAPAVDEPEFSFDGLEAVDSRSFTDAWIRPGVSLDSYRAVSMQSVRFEFLPVNAETTSELWLGGASLDELIETVTSEMREQIELAQGWSPGESDGRDTLNVEARLLGITATVPPERVGAGELFLGDVSAVTLVVELRDAVSGTLVYRAVGPGVAGSQRNNARSTAATTWAEVSRWARRWGEHVVEELESIRPDE